MPRSQRSQPDHHRRPHASKRRSSPAAPPTSFIVLPSVWLKMADASTVISSPGHATPSIRWLAHRFENPPISTGNLFATVLASSSESGFRSRAIAVNPPVSTASILYTRAHGINSSFLSTDREPMLPTNKGISFTHTIQSEFFSGIYVFCGSIFV